MVILEIFHLDSKEKAYGFQNCHVLLGSGAVEGPCNRKPTARCLHSVQGDSVSTTAKLTVILKTIAC